MRKLAMFLCLGGALVHGALCHFRMKKTHQAGITIRNVEIARLQALAAERDAAIVALHHREAVQAGERAGADLARDGMLANAQNEVQAANAELTEAVAANEEAQQEHAVFRLASEGEIARLRQRESELIVARVARDTEVARLRQRESELTAALVVREDEAAAQRAERVASQREVQRLLERESELSGTLMERERQAADQRAELAASQREVERLHGIEAEIRAAQGAAEREVRRLQFRETELLVAQFDKAQEVNAERLARDRRFHSREAELMASLAAKEAETVVLKGRLEEKDLDYRRNLVDLPGMCIAQRAELREKTALLAAKEEEVKRLQEQVHHLGASLRTAEVRYGRVEQRAENLQSKLNSNDYYRLSQRLQKELAIKMRHSTHIERELTCGTDERDRKIERLEKRVGYLSGIVEELGGEVLLEGNPELEPPEAKTDLAKKKPGIVVKTVNKVRCFLGGKIQSPDDMGFPPVLPGDHMRQSSYTSLDDSPQGCSTSSSAKDHPAQSPSGSWRKQE